ncbi:MAG TPA: retropepsin-like aspartic protease [Chryseosolibacter sp.]|nr:retropepsin-like aspartic protease [Chryseosolibacter sp.]
MKSFQAIIAIFLLFFSSVAVFGVDPAAGFFLPDSVNEMTLKYKTMRGLVILPVMINDSIRVNLILDTGCRNLILFGKKFKKLLPIHSGKAVQFSGLGNGRPVTGSLSLGNKVSIGEVLGEQIPVVVVGSNNLFGICPNVDGVIGYDIFLKFEIELNPNLRTITFRPAMKSTPPSGFTKVPIRIIDARPIMASHVYLYRDASKSFDLMIDTGSSLGLLLKTTKISEMSSSWNEQVLGIGFNGRLSGYHVTADKLLLADLSIQGVSTGIVSSPWHNNASLGMQVLKDYILVLNYCKAYACFKKYDA